jgi:hypothetical protein
VVKRNVGLKIERLQGGQKNDGDGTIKGMGYVNVEGK